MHREVTSIITLLLQKNIETRPTVEEVLEDKFKLLQTLKKKVRRSKTQLIPVLTLAKTIRHHALKLPKEDISVLSNHLVSVPPAPFQIECPICKDITKVPHQTDCCGKNFCLACIQKAKKERGECPTCNQRNYNTLPDKGLQIALQKLQIYCPNVNEGCKWIGELKQIESHLNCQSSESKQLEGCLYVQIQCIYCSNMFQRSKMRLHKDSQCPKRPFTCQFCRNYHSVLSDVEKNHWPVCPSFLIKCEQKCGELIPRKDYRNHLENECLQATIICNQTGCNLVLTRKDLLAHIADVHIMPSKLRESIHQAFQIQSAAVKRRFHSQYTQHHSVSQKRSNSRKHEHLARSIYIGEQPTNIICEEEQPISSLGDMNFHSQTHHLTTSSLVQPPEEPFLTLMKCPRCLQIVKEPHQVLCCGRNLCKQCLDNTKVNKNTQCPSCKGSITDSFFNKGLHHVLSELYIVCPHARKKCEWKGKMSDLDKHLNPDSEDPNDGCKYVEVVCQDCNCTYARHLSTEHKTKECSKRLFKCTYCNKYESNYEDVAANHWHVCSQYLIKCPRKCGITVERQKLSNHLSSQCSFRQKTHWLGISSETFIRAVLMLVLVCPIFLLIPLIYLQKSHELAIYTRGCNKICQQWKFSTMTVTVSFLEIYSKGICIAEYELRDINLEWQEEFEFETMKRLVISTSDEICHDLKNCIIPVFKDVNAMEHFQTTIIIRAQLAATHFNRKVLI